MAEIFREQMRTLASKTPEVQAEEFKKRWVFKLKQNNCYFEVEELLTKYNTQLKLGSPGKDNMSQASAANFLQKIGMAMTATQLKSQLKEFDFNGDGRLSFIEFMCLKYKILMLKEFYDRKGLEHPESLQGDSMSLTGVGPQIIEEMFAPPQGVDPELEKMMNAFAASQGERVRKLADLEAVVAAGGIKAISASKDLETLKSGSSADLNHLEAKISAAIKKANKAATDEMAKLNSDKDAAIAAENEARKAGLASKR